MPVSTIIGEVESAKKEENTQGDSLPLRDSATTCMVAELVVGTEYHEFYDAVYERRSSGEGAKLGRSQERGKVIT